MINIRPVTQNDIPCIIRLFQDAVHSINARDYSSAQLQVWAPSHIDPNHARWQGMLQNIAFVALLDDKIVGFADMTNAGYFDRLFVHKDYQHPRIAYRLFNTIIQTAKEHGIRNINADISITVKSLAEKMGFQLVREQDVRIHGITLRNYHMELNLAD